MELDDDIGGNFHDIDSDDDVDDDDDAAKIEYVRDE